MTIDLSPDRLTLSIDLGQLTWACNAVPNYYLVQDPKTREFHQILVTQRPPAHQRFLKWLRFHWHHSRWPKAFCGVAAAVAVFGAGAMADRVRTAQATASPGPVAAAAVVQPAAPQTTAVAPSAAPFTTVPLPAGGAASAPVAAPAPVLSAAPVQPLPDPPVVDQPMAGLLRTPVRLVESKPPKTAHGPAASREHANDKERDKKEDNPVIVDEAPEAAKAPRTSSADHPARTQVTEPTAAAKGPQRREVALVRAAAALVAIPDANSIFVTAPGSRLPVRVSLGGALPNGKRLKAIDAGKGIVTLDDGSSLRLE